MRLDKLLALLAFIFLTCALVVIATTGPAIGYEISIYSAYPPYFWFFLIAGFALGIGILVHQAFSKEQSNWWLAGLAVVLLSNVVLLLLPYFRGYVAVGPLGTLKTIGYTRDILATGRIGAPFTVGEDFYPGVHLLLAASHYVSGLSLETLSLLLPSFMVVFFILSVTLLAQQITTSHGRAVFVLVLAALPIYTLVSDVPSLAFLIPRTFVFWLVPLVLYLFYRTYINGRVSVGHQVSLLLLVLAGPFFHPLDGGLLLPVFFLFMGLSAWICQRQSASERMLAVGFPLGIAIIPFVIWFLWFSPFWAFSAAVKHSWAVLFSPEKYSEATWWINAAGRVGVSSISEALFMVLRKIAHQLPYFFLSGIISLVVLGRLLFFRSRAGKAHLTFSLLLGVSVASASVSVIAASIGGTTRTHLYVLLFAAMLVGSWGCDACKRKIAVGATVGLLVASSVLGVLNTYSWPFNTGMNLQVTQADVKGMEWFLHAQNQTFRIEDTFVNQWELGICLAGFKGSPRNIILAEGNRPLPHFGYDKSNSYGALLKENTYFLSYVPSVIWEQTVNPKHADTWRWTPQDYARFEVDPAVSRVYSNKEFEVYLVAVLKSSP